MNPSNRTPARHVSSIKGGQLSRLRAGAQFQQQLEKLVMTTLKAQGEQYQAILPNCRGAALRDDTLILFVSSGSWASRLRFVQTELLAAVNKELGAEIRHFKAKVAAQAVDSSPELGGPQKPAPQKAAPRISEASAETLMTAAMSEPDAELAERLARLASRFSHKA